MNKDADNVINASRTIEDQKSRPPTKPTQESRSATRATIHPALMRPRARIAIAARIPPKNSIHGKEVAPKAITEFDGRIPVTK